MDESHPLPSNKKNKKGKKRKRPSKMSPPSNASFNSSTSGHKTESVDHEPLPSPKTTRNDTDSINKVRSGDYPYPTDYNDHFETPARAYDDIFPLLLEHILAKQKAQNKKRKNKSTKQTKDQEGKLLNETTIYDPYYCAGRAATLLEDVFKQHGNKRISTSIRIQHEKKDFYQDIRQNTVPKFDILITNPPYSGNHKERCLEFAVGQLKKFGRPFFLLMPNYVATKDYFRKIVLDDKDASGSSRVQTFYITPSSNHPYEYDHPEGTGHQTSPFASVWFCGLRYGEGKLDAAAVKAAFAKFHQQIAQSSTGMPRIATSLQELIRTGGVSGEKRKNPRQRRKMRQQAMQRANNVAAVGETNKTNVGQNAGDNGRKQPRSNKRKSDGHGMEHGKKRGNSNKRRKSK